MSLAFVTASDSDDEDEDEGSGRRGADGHEDDEDLGPRLRVVSGAVQLRRRVLVVEDSDPLRETLGEVVRAEGYEAVEAKDGEEAWTILSDTHVDVVILDLHLPNRDGVSILRELGEPPPLVIVNSAFEFYSPGQLREIGGRSVIRTLRKPTAPSKLLEAVADAVTAIEALEAG
jgi:CheY-like chemotaxis protein